MEEQNVNQNMGQEQPQGQAQAQAEPTMQSGTSDVDANKLVAVLGYIFPIIFFIPLLSEEGKKSTFAMFHANQHLNLFLMAIVVNVVGGVIPILGWFIILPLGLIALLVFAIMGLINAAGGKMKPLPLIGKFQILK